MLLSPTLTVYLQEHRLGRWHVQADAKNQCKVYDLEALLSRPDDSSASEDDDMVDN
jgi:hypothetical protein